MPVFLSDGTGPPCVASSFTGIQTANTRNNRFQLQTFTAATRGSGGRNVVSLSFNFNQGTSGAPIDNGLLGEPSQFKSCRAGAQWIAGVAKSLIKMAERVGFESTTKCTYNNLQGTDG